MNWDLVMSDGAIHVLHSDNQSQMIVRKFSSEPGVDTIAGDHLVYQLELPTSTTVDDFESGHLSVK